MFRNDRMLRPMESPRTVFPLAEGIGIFVGVTSWDLLADGHPDVVKALLIAIPATLVWFGLRCWIDRARGK